MPAKSFPDRSWVGVIKVLVRAPSREAAVELLKQRMAVGWTDDLGQIVDYGFIRTGPFKERSSFEEKNVTKDFFQLMEDVRRDELDWPEDPDSDQARECNVRIDEYEKSFDDL